LVPFEFWVLNFYEQKNQGEKYRTDFAGLSPTNQREIIVKFAIVSDAKVVQWVRD